MKKITAAILFNCVSVLSLSGQEIDSTQFELAPRYEAGFGTSTLGLTANAAYLVNDKFKVRGIAATFGAYEANTDDLDFDFASSASGTISGSFHSLGLVADYDVFKSGGLQISGGLLHLGLKLDGEINGALSLDSGASANTTVETSVKFNNQIAPMISAGYQQNIGDHFALFGELGAVYVDGFDVDINEVGASLLPAADLEAEAKKVESELDMPVYPFLHFGLKFRF